MATPAVTRSIEEIYQQWRPQILETSRNRDSIARAISDAEGHGSTPAENVGAYQELKTATRAVDHVMFEFCRECQASGFANYSTSLQGRMAYSLATPPPWATIYVMRAQNLIHTSSSSSSSES